MKRFTILVAAVMFEASPIPAAAGPWCLIGETTDCYQPTFEMCNYARIGQGGSLRLARSRLAAPSNKRWQAESALMREPDRNVQFELYSGKPAKHW